MNFKVENWKLLVLSVFYVIFAVISYMVKKEQFLNFFMIAGLIVAVVGLLQIMAYFFKKEYMKPNEFQLCIWRFICCGRFDCCDQARCDRG